MYSPPRKFSLSKIAAFTNLNDKQLVDILTSSHDDAKEIIRRKLEVAQLKEDNSALNELAKHIFQQISQKEKTLEQSLKFKDSLEQSCRILKP